MFNFEDFRGSLLVPELRETYSFKELSTRDKYAFYQMREELSYDNLVCDLYAEYDATQNPVLLFKIADRIQTISPNRASSFYFLAYSELKKNKSNPEARKYLKYLMAFLWKEFFDEAINKDNTLYMKDFFDPQFIINEVLVDIISLDDEKEFSNYAKEAFVALSYCYAFGIVVKKDLKRAKEYLDKGILYHVSKLDYKCELSSYIERGIASYSFIFKANKLKFLTDYYMLSKNDSINFNCPRLKSTEVFFHYAFNTSIAKDYLKRIIFYYVCNNENYYNIIKSNWTLSNEEEAFFDELVNGTYPVAGEISFIKLPAHDEKYTFRMATKEEIEQCDFYDKEAKATFCVICGGKVLAFYNLQPSSNVDGMEYELNVFYNQDIDETTRKNIEQIVFEHMKKDEFVIKESTYSLKYEIKPLHPSFITKEIEYLKNADICSSPYSGDISYNMYYFAKEDSCINEDSEVVVYQF